MSSLKKQIMRRVYIVWVMRKIASPFSLKVAIAAVFLWQLSSYVSLSHVVANSPLSRGDVIASFYFLKSAFVHTETIVLVLITGIAIVGGLLVRDTIRKRMGEVHALAQV